MPTMKMTIIVMMVLNKKVITSIHNTVILIVRCIDQL